MNNVFWETTAYQRHIEAKKRSWDNIMSFVSFVLFFVALFAVAIIH